jgi:hypothetical protein
MPATPPHSTLQIVVLETETVPNAKGLGSITRAVQSVREISPEELGNRFREFCISLNSALQNLTLPVSEMSLDQIELSVELTSKGEVRMIASASAEIKGGFKLIFKRSTQGH